MKRRMPRGRHWRRLPHHGILLAGALQLAGVYAAPAHAAGVLTITSASDPDPSTCPSDATTASSLTLRCAVAAVNAGEAGQIAIAPAPRGIVLDYSELLLSRDVTITGPAGMLLTPEPTYLTRLFEVAAGVHAMPK